MTVSVTGKANLFLRGVFRGTLPILKGKVGNTGRFLESLRQERGIIFLKKNLL